MTPLPRFKASPATPHRDRHTIHAYFTNSPESPDGRYLLYYTSATAKGHEGDLRLLDRKSGEEKIIVDGIIAEDAHRVAVQQWACGGRKIVYQNLDQGHWTVCVYDLESGKTKILARERQIGLTQPNLNVIPLAGLHWDGESYRNMDLLNLETGEVHPVITAEAVRAAYPEWTSRLFGKAPISVTAGMLSPNGKRTFFKIAAPAGGEMQSSTASNREGLICYDLEERRFRFLLEKWGHPTWMSDNRHILNVKGLITDSDDGSSRTLPNWPNLSGSHPSPSPDRKLWVSDAGWHHVDDPHIWHIMVGALDDGHGESAHQFGAGGGATSWRPPHPHPAFTADGQRIYFHAMDTPFTELHVLERTRPEG